MVLSTCGVSGRSVVFIEENILIYTWNFPCSNLRCCLSLCYCAPLRRIRLYLVYTLLLGSCRSSLCLSSLKAGQTQFSSVRHAPQSPLCLNGPPLDSLKYVNVIFIVESQKQDTVLQVWSSKCQTEKNNQFCRPAVHTPANTAQYVAGHLHCKGMLVNHVQHLSTRTSKQFSAKLLSLQVAPTHTAVGVMMLQMQDFALLSVLSTDHSF